jgi:pyruvate ferredoxin oxidoreductase gamma subunit
MIGIRFHGRGGQGAKIASRILGRSGFLCGLHVQDFALFGAERRGAPVVSFTRLSDKSIHERGYIDRPNLVVVMDDSLLREAAKQVFQGVSSRTPLFVNTDPDHLKNDLNDLPPANFVFLDLSAIARELTGSAFVSVAAAAAAAKCVPSINLTAVHEAVRTELAEFGLPPASIEKNVAAATEAYSRAPAACLPPHPAAEHDAVSPGQAMFGTGKSQLIGPTIRHPGSATQRQTGNWRQSTH